MAFREVTLYGGGGSNIGHHLLQALAKDDTFETTVLARESSKTKYPASVKVSRVPDDFPHDALVTALRGQDVLICAPEENNDKLLEAAIEAGVKRFIPSEWGMDNGDPKNQKLSPIFKRKSEFAEVLKTKETQTFSWTTVATSIWLEWALDTPFIGVDPIAHTVEYWRDGKHPCSMTTLAYAAKATLGALKYPKETKNKRIFLSPFEASQSDVIAELEKLQGVKYSVSHVPEDIVEQTHAKIAAGDQAAVYTTVVASLFLKEYAQGFKTAGKVPIVEDFVELPKLTVEQVVREWVEAHPETVVQR